MVQFRLWLHMGSRSLRRHRCFGDSSMPCWGIHHCNRSRLCRKILNLLGREQRWSFRLKQYRIYLRKLQLIRRPSMNRIVLDLWLGGCNLTIGFWHRSLMGLRRLLRGSHQLLHCWVLGCKFQVWPRVPRESSWQVGWLLHHGFTRLKLIFWFERPILHWLGE